MTNATPIAIRLAGGIGGHLLGMRVLTIAHQRMPDRRIIVYSDCANPIPLKVVAMSPVVAEIIQDGAQGGESEATAAIDASGEDLLAAAAIALRTPLFDLLAARPVLRIPDWAAGEADTFLRRFPASSSSSSSSSFVGVCFASDEPETLRQFESRILDAIRLALGSSETIALNFFITTGTNQSSQILDGLSALDPRIVPCPDLPIEVVAALLARCRYFAGGDNGIKHLAWALDIPRTFFLKERPPRLQILRWMPDVHRSLLFESR